MSRAAIPVAIIIVTLISTSMALAPVREDHPRLLSLGPTSPNPFSCETTLTLDIPVAPGELEVVVNVYDPSGRLVRTLAADGFPAGTHRLVWDGRNGRGERVRSGIYFVRMMTAQGSLTRKVAIVR
jgi:flagellar hook assembly protein FlgD